MRNDLVIFAGRAFDDETLTRSDLKVLYHIGAFARRGDGPYQGWAWPSLRTLALVSGLSKPTVVKAVATLVEGRYLTVEPSKNANGSWGPNHYYVLLDTDIAHQPGYTPLHPENQPTEIAPEETPGPTEKGSKAHLSTPLSGSVPGGKGLPSETLGEGGKGLPSQGYTRNGNRNGKKKTTIPTVTRITWLTPYFDAWKEIVGEPPTGQLARYLHPLDQRYGAAVLVPPFRTYLRESDPQYVSCARFAATVEKRLHPTNGRSNGVAKQYDYGSGTTDEVTL